MKNQPISAKRSSDSLLTGITLVVTLAATAPVQAQQNTTYQFEYDPVGNLTAMIDPRGQRIEQSFDKRNRLIQQIHPAPSATLPTSVVGFAYDNVDQISQITDPRVIQTNYTVTGLGDMRTEFSRDRGNTSQNYDRAGNQIFRRDGRTKEATYAYDAINRLVSITYESGTGTSFEYDGGANPTPGAVGQVTRMTDESGFTTYSYDDFGRIRSQIERHRVNGVNKVFATRYGYAPTGNTFDKLSWITYPSGNRVRFVYDISGRIVRMLINPVKADGSGPEVTTQTNLLTNINYHPMGQPTNWRWAGDANNINRRTIDVDGRVRRFSLGKVDAGGSDRIAVYDEASRITTYVHRDAANVTIDSLTQRFSYDDQNRLIRWRFGTTDIRYAYDENGNRRRVVIPPEVYPYRYPGTRNRLTNNDGPLPAQVNTYDNMGNLLTNGTATFTYSDRGRMSSASVGPETVNYLYNGNGERVVKFGIDPVVPTGERHFVYDTQGRMIGEYNADGSVVQETVYLGDIPVVVLKTTNTGTAEAQNNSTQIYNVYADQINTPRIITEATTDQIVWRWDGAEPFGASLANDNPDQAGVFEYNPRFPGQNYDVETGLHYNYFRDYDPTIGRYVQSDPLGLDGGTNPYQYARSNPLTYVDPSGEHPIIGWALAIGGAVWAYCEFSGTAIETTGMKDQYVSDSEALNQWMMDGMHGQPPVSRERINESLGKALDGASSMAKQGIEFNAGIVNKAGGAARRLAD